MKKIGSIILFFLIVFHPLESKVHIFSYGLNYLIFAYAQSLSFKKYLKDDFVYYLILDELNNNTTTLQKRAAKHNLPCVLIPAEISRESGFFKQNGSIAGNLSKIFAHIYKKISIRQGDILVWMPYNIFAIKDFSFQQQMKNIDLMGGIAQTSFFDMMPVINPECFVVNENALRQQFSIGFEQLFLEGKMMQIGNKYYYQVPVHSQLRFSLIDKSPTTNENLFQSPFSKLVSISQNKIMYLFNSAFIQYTTDWAKSSSAENAALHEAVKKLK